MSRYATATVVYYKGVARSTEIRGIKEALEVDPAVHMPVVTVDPKRPGILLLNIDVCADDFLAAGQAAYGCVARALEHAGFNRNTMLVESAVERMVGAEFTRPRGLREFAAAAAAA